MSLRAVFKQDDHETSLQTTKFDTRSFPVSSDIEGFLILANVVIILA